MKSFLSSRWFLRPLRIGLGGLFLYAGSRKLLDPLAFADSIATFQMLSKQCINILALGLPPFEIILGCFLVGGWKTRTASLGITLLTMIFGMALAQAILRGLTIDCGCFGSGHPSPMQPWFSLGRDVLLFAAGIWLNLRSREKDQGRLQI